MRMKILITNDDGIKASGIIRLAEAAKKYGEVWVVAPDGQRSAASHSITLRTYIDAFEYDFPVAGVHAYATTGTPADCVRIGVRNIVPGGPDLILSGINDGYNAGTDAQYSATIGAAMEGVFQGIPAIALSEGFGDEYQVTDACLDDALEKAIAYRTNAKVSEMEIVNVNFPQCKPEDVKGILLDRINSRESVFVDSYNETPIDGGIRYMVEGAFVGEAEEGTDLRALYDNYISIGIIRNIGR